MRRIAVVVPLLVLLAGCGAGGESGGSNATAAKADSGGGGMKAAAPPGAQLQPALAKTKPVAVPRSLIRTADMQVRVHDVKKSAAAAQELVEAAGGEVSDEELDLQASHPTARMQLRVPPARLGSTLGRLSELGEEQSRKLGTDDVTDQVVDLDSRLATQSSSVVRVR